MPVNLLAILAAAAVAIVYGTYLPIHALLVVAFAGAAVAVIIQAAPTKGAPITPDKFDERDTDRVLTLGAYSGVLAVAGVVLLIAFASPAGAFAFLGIAAAWVLVWWLRRLRTFAHTSSIVIERDPATVFAFVSNMENEPRYWPLLEQVEKLTPGPIGPGTQFRSRIEFPASRRLGPQSYEGVDEIIEYEPNRGFTSSVTSGIHANSAVVTVEPVPNGTRLTHHFEMVVSYSTGVSGGVLMFGRSARRDLITNRAIAWAKAKEILESDGQATP